MPNIKRLCLTALFLLTLNACSARQDATLPSAPPKTRDVAAELKAGQIWKQFMETSGKAAAASGPFRISATMRYKGEDGTNNRVSVLFWGNGNPGSPRPLRLDLLAGIGIVAAQIREDAKNFVAFVPNKKISYTYDGESRTISSFGVPLPLSLSDLALLLTGCYGELFSPGAVRMPRTYALTARGAEYALEKTKLGGILELSETGLPLSWREDAAGWSMDMEYAEDAQAIPERLRVSHPRGYSALVIIRDMERVSPPYESGQLALLIPEGTENRAITPR
ncbi:MAG: hypothetical protein LBU06_07365 [Desulfovibrio sp.]|jgi:hypothetical protein|nr:hypothetical protein [Desulfovibrio sp.]